MNPDKNYRRGCFIRHESENDKFTVVDYPTWTAGKYGMFFKGQNDPLPEGTEAEVSFDTRSEALAFCAAENMVVCACPGTAPAPSPVPQSDDDEM